MKTNKDNLQVYNAAYKTSLLYIEDTSYYENMVNPSSRENLVITRWPYVRVSVRRTVLCYNANFTNRQQFSTVYTLIDHRRHKCSKLSVNFRGFTCGRFVFYNNKLELVFCSKTMRNRKEVLQRFWRALKISHTEKRQ